MILVKPAQIDANKLHKGLFLRIKLSNKRRLRRPFRQIYMLCQSHDPKKKQENLGRKDITLSQLSLFTRHETAYWIHKLELDK